MFVVISYCLDFAWSPYFYLTFFQYTSTKDTRFSHNYNLITVPPMSNYGDIGINLFSSVRTEHILLLFLRKFKKNTMMGWIT